jgi:hypothetical protein
MGAFVVMVGCGGTETGGPGTPPGPCDLPNPPAECGSACATDTDCGDALFCAPDRTCTAQCGVGTAGCASGQMCAAHGRCIPVDGCPNVAVAVTPVIPTVQILIDQSGSMTESFGTINGQSVDRWEGERYALTDPDVGAVTVLQDRVRFGAVMYHSEGGSAGGACPMLAHTVGTPAGMPALNNADAIRQLFADNGPNQDTPTSESVDAVHAEMLSYPIVDADSQAPMVLVLSTDGNPDTCENSDAHNAASQALSEAAVQRTWADGIKVVPLSVGSDVTDSHMQKLANLGSGLAADASPGAPWYRGNDPAQLVDAFNEIIRGVRTCTFNLSSPVDPTSGNEGIVTLNGTTLLNGVDWTVGSDGTTIELLGSACDTFLNTDSVQLSAEFPCGTVID